MFAKVEPLLDAFRSDTSFKEFVLGEKASDSSVRIVFYSPACVGVLRLENGLGSKYCVFSAYFPIRTLGDPWFHLDTELSLRGQDVDENSVEGRLRNCLWPKREADPCDMVICQPFGNNFNML